MASPSSAPVTDRRQDFHPDLLRETPTSILCSGSTAFKAPDLVHPDPATARSDDRHGCPTRCPLSESTTTGVWWEGRHPTQSNRTSHCPSRQDRGNRGQSHRTTGTAPPWSWAPPLHAAPGSRETSPLPPATSRCAANLWPTTPPATPSPERSRYDQIRDDPSRVRASGATDDQREGGEDLLSRRHKHGLCPAPTSGGDGGEGGDRGGLAARVWDSRAALTGERREREMQFRINA